MTVQRNPDRLIAAWFAERAPEAPDRLFDAVRSDIHRTRQRLVPWSWRPFAGGRGMRVVPVALALVLLGLLVLGLAGFGPGRGQPTPAANVFQSPFYGYAVTIPPRWGVTPATVVWDGESAPSVGPNVDLITGPHLIVLGFAGPFAGDLAAFTQDRIAASLRDHADTCGANALQSTTSIGIGGQPGALLAMSCGAAIDQAITVHDGFAYDFTIRDAGFLPSLDQTDLASVRSMLQSLTFPSTPVTSP